MNCENCSGTIIQTSVEYVCIDCGLITNEKLISNYTYIDTTPKTTMKKIYTNQEKSLYNLKKHIINFCRTLNIPEQLIENIKELSMIVLTTIAKFDNVKRSNVKNGIILMCIEYVSKGNYTAYNLAKMIDLHIKHVTKAEELIYSLTNTGKLRLN